MQEIFVKMFVIDFTNDCKQKPRGSLHHVEKTIYWIICFLLHTIHDERRSDSMNNYQLSAMPSTNARRWTRTTELEREQIYSLSSLPLDYTCLLKD